MWRFTTRLETGCQCLYMYPASCHGLSHIVFVVAPYNQLVLDLTIIISLSVPHSAHSHPLEYSPLHLVLCILPFY